jgi:hypothetical protein
MSMAKQTKSSLSANLDWDVLWERFGDSGYHVWHL